MRSRWPSRALAFVLALWLPLCLADAPMAHVCPMHDVGMARMPGMHMGNADHADQGGPVGPQHGTPSHSRCTCFGPCAAAGGLAPSPTVRLAEARATVREDGAVIVANEQPYAAPQVRLPFAMGPPAPAAASSSTL